MKRENQINEPVRMVQSYQPWLNAAGGGQYADAYLTMIVQRIFAGLRNVAYVAETDNTFVKTVADFLTKNIQLLTWQLWTTGYVVLSPVKHNDNVVDFDIITTPVNKDAQGRVMGYELVYYSDTYRYQRKSDWSVLKPNLDFLNTVKNGDNYLTANLGAFGILCGKTMPINQADKENFLTRLKQRIGISKENFQIEVFNSEVDFKQVDFHIKDLQLAEKIKDEVKLLCAYFNVPYDLIPLSGQSTYANQEQAVKQFYGNCISPLAETGLDIGRYIIAHSKELVPSNRLTFRIDNVPELADDRTAEIEYKRKVAELCKICIDAGLQVNLSEYYKQIETIER